MEKSIEGLLDGLSLFRRGVEILEWTDAPWMAENPVSTISSYFRKPDFTFDPCEYAGYLSEPERCSEAYTKKTGAGFRMPETRPVTPLAKSPIHYMAPSPNRGHKRSVTPRGFARAVFEANFKPESHPLVPNLGNDLIACKTYFASDVTISGVDNNPARVMQQARPEQVIDF